MKGPILLLGRNGQLGWELQRALAVLGPVTPLGREACDLTDADAVRALVRGLRPYAIVNAAAYTAVDQAETEPAAAMRLNAELPGILAREARALDAWLLHYSTDYVFDGRKSGAYTEADAVGPLSVYGHSKLAGEEAVRAAGGKHLILRTSWVFGAHGGNFLKTMLRLARERTQLEVVDDQFGAPTSAALIADASAHLLMALRHGRGQAGTYHLASAGTTSWCRYARYVLARAEHLGLALRCPADAVRAIPGSAYPTPAARPANSRLDTSLLRDSFGLDLPAWEDQVDRVLATLLLKD